MYDAYMELGDGDNFRKRLIETGALELVNEFEQVVNSLTDEDFAEMRAAIEEFPLEQFETDADTD